VSPAPPPERPRDESATGFERKPMVRWLDPVILADAALRVMLSTVFGQYADKREAQQALPARDPVAYPAQEDGAVWVDFVADLGDGFDPTYAVACLLGRERLEFEKDGSRLELPRGRALVMGGDQVYPSATREEYENRFRGPYTAAFPAPPPVGDQPDLYAIPGNHDWYDGLTNFLRFFCSDRQIGGWQTRQSRSYFALKLPGRWWLLGIDIQLDTYIDSPQMSYFKGVGLQPGDRVILVTGKPSWVKVPPGDPEAAPDSYKNLRYFKDEIVRAAGAEVRATLTGDLHHYYRYEALDRSQLVTSGAGGAYLFPTHTLQPALSLPDEPNRFHRAATYPSREESERLKWGALKLPLHAPRLALLIAILYALLGAAVYAARDAGPGFFALAGAFALLMFGALFAYAAAETGVGKLVMGGAHTAVHVLLAGAPAWIAHALGAEGAGWGLAVALGTGILGLSLGGVVFGLYLVATHKLAPKHANEVFACQSITGYKGFLRIRVAEDGLTIHPIGVRDVPREWELQPDAEPQEPWWRPADGPLKAELIEGPVFVPVDSA
jgi:hypothetical protein